MSRPTAEIALKRTLTLLTLGAFLMIPAAFAAAQETAVPPAAKADEAGPVLAKAVKPPVIDGVLDDEAWATGLKFDGFKTLEPYYDKYASHKCYVNVA